MAISLSDGRISLRTVLVDKSSGQEIVLFEREGRRCQFAKTIFHKDFEINLRIDWGDIEYGDPSLDADIYRIVAKGKRKRITNRGWHHTKVSFPAPGDIRSYRFCFQDLTLELVARKTLSTSIGFSVYIADA
jgi:hypothetical protein